MNRGKNKNLKENQQVSRRSKSQSYLNDPKLAAMMMAEDTSPTLSMNPQSQWPQEHVDWARKRDDCLLNWHRNGLLLNTTWAKAATRGDKITMVKYTTQLITTLY